MHLWPLIHAERAALAEGLNMLDDEQWAAQSLCGTWSIREVVAHLSAAASVGRLGWFRSVLGARFDFDLHNQRRLAEHLGATNADTLAEYHRIIPSTTAPMGPTAAWLGEVVVHSADIRRPLRIDRTPPSDVVTEVARFYASRDFAVPSRSAFRGLRLEATDGPFTSGSGPVIRGSTLALVMAMAGRDSYCHELAGDGAALLRSRFQNSWAQSSRPGVTSHHGRRRGWGFALHSAKSSAQRCPRWGAGVPRGMPRSGARHPSVGPL